MKELVFYRCTLCAHVVSPWDLDKGGCQHCGGVRIKPTNLSLWEKLIQIIKHPRIWEWHKVTAGQSGEAAR
jgi:hypothetical protein